jgi:hypothetical protein
MRKNSSWLLGFSLLQNQSNLVQHGNAITNVAVAEYSNETANNIIAAVSFD